MFQIGINFKLVRNYNNFNFLYKINDILAFFIYKYKLSLKITNKIVKYHIYS